MLDIDPASALELLVATATRRPAPGRRGAAIHLCNAYTLTLAAQEPEFARLLRGRALNLPDGVPVTWFSRLQTGRRPHGPVRGPSLLRSALLEPGLRHFFLGGTSVVLQRIVDAASVANPDISISGVLAPPFADVGPEQIEQWSATISASGANVVWVGLGTPKQDLVVAGLAERVPAAHVGIGAAFDFLAGTKREAPELLHGSGLEWVHRMANEPSRLWRRYLVGNAQFCYHAARQLGTRTTRVATASVDVTTPQSSRDRSVSRS